MRPCILLNSLLTCFVMNFFLKTVEVHCACIHYHSHTYIRHRDIASLRPRHTSKNTPRVCTLVLSFRQVRIKGKGDKIEMPCTHIVHPESLRMHAQCELRVRGNTPTQHAHYNACRFYSVRDRARA